MNTTITLIEQGQNGILLKANLRFSYFDLKKKHILESRCLSTVE